MEQQIKEKTQHEKDLDEKHKATMLQEQLWFTGTVVGGNVLVLQSFIGKINSLIILEISIVLNIFAIHLVLDRARAYRKINNDRVGNDLRMLWISIGECSGSLFYVLLIFFSFLGILLQLIAG